jgi:hypothetical protein
MSTTAELAERYGATGEVDAHGFYYTPVDVAIRRMLAGPRSPRT